VIERSSGSPVTKTSCAHTTANDDVKLWSEDTAESASDQHRSETANGIDSNQIRPNPRRDAPAVRPGKASDERQRGQMPCSHPVRLVQARMAPADGSAPASLALAGASADAPVGRPYAHGRRCVGVSGRTVAPTNLVQKCLNGLHDLLHCVQGGNDPIGDL
jgi:hypothetical protein